MHDSGSDSNTDDNDTDSTTSDVDDWANTTSTTEEFIPDEVSLTLTKYTTKDRKKKRNSTDIYEAGPPRQTFPNELSFPDLSALVHSKHQHVQNPYSSLYKDRSFYLEPKQTDRSLDENTLATNDDLYVSNRNPKKQNGKLDGVSTELIGASSLVDINEMAKDMAVFGKKADYNARKGKTPPNTPLSCGSATSKKTSKSHISVALMNKKRAQSLDKRLSVQTLDDEPFQRYERSKTGQIVPTGSPRSYHTELPSMKDKYKRDKLLKIERDTQFSHNMKMKRFFSTFDKGNYAHIVPFTFVKSHRICGNTLTIDRSGSKSLEIVF